MPKTILLVEDSVTTQKAVMTAFAHGDFEIVTAHDATAALYQLRTLRPDIVVADAAMADMDGFRLCQIIRATDWVRHVPVLLLTSSFTTYDKRRGEQAGVTAHLAKPFEHDVLQYLVEQLVEQTPPAETPLQPPTVAASQPATWSIESLEALPSLQPDVTEPPQTPNHTAPKTASSETTSVPAQQPQPDQALQALLGHSLLHMLREAFEAHLEQLMQQLTPHILDTVQETVRTKVPTLLEELLQREIDKLKQAVERDGPDGDEEGGPFGTAQSL
jgi:DNA-binding response OmpR family regulator